MAHSVDIAALPFQVFCAGASAPLNLIHHHAVDVHVPIGCGGVAVYPGDVIVGDDDGVVVIPRHLADEVAAQSIEQEQLERFVIEKINNGAPLPGTYRPMQRPRPNTKSGGAARSRPVDGTRYAFGSANA